MSYPKRVLLISYFFSPNETIGAVRPGKFYQYLPEYGWDPYVLTIATPGLGEDRAPASVIRTNYWSPWKHLERRRNQQRTSVSATPSTRPEMSLRQASLRSPLRRRLYFALRHMLPMSSVRMPDAALGWYPYAVRAGRKLLRSQAFDVLWSTSGPPTSHLVARQLHLETGLPWIADYRDLWTLNYQDRRVAVFSAVEARWEKKVLADASRIITVSKGFAEVMSQYTGRSIDIIYNGHDGNEDKCSDSADIQSGQFVLRYTGSLYPDRQDIRPLLQAVAELEQKNPTFSPRVEFIGPELEWVANLVDHYQVAGLVKCFSSVSRLEASALQHSATALLLFGWTGEEMPGVLPAKMFEYMKTGNPVLEIGPPHSESASIIADCEAGKTVQSIPDIKRVLMDWWRTYQTCGYLPHSTNMEAVRRYSRRSQAGKLADILTEVSR